MAYKFRLGTAELSGTMTTDDITYKEDSDTGIDFEQDYIGFDIANSTVMCVSGSRVGIGTDAPPELLTLHGPQDGSQPAIQFQEAGSDRAKIFINSSNNLEIKQQYTNKHIVFKVLDAGNTREAFRMDGAVPEVVVNQTGDSLVDFRVESDNNTHMLFVDGGNDLVGINHSSPASTLTVGGSLALRVTTFNAANDPGTTYTITDTECVILVNTRPTAEGGIDSAITLTLPSASDNPGMVIIVKDAAGYSNVNNIVLTRAGSDTIEGVATSLTLNNAAQKTTLISDGISVWSEIGN